MCVNNYGCSVFCVLLLHKLTAGDGHHFIAWTIKDTFRTPLTVCQAWLSNVVTGNIAQPCDLTKQWIRIICTEKLENNTPCSREYRTDLHCWWQFATHGQPLTFVSKNCLIHSDLHMSPRAADTSQINNEYHLQFCKPHKATVQQSVYTQCGHVNYVCGGKLV